MAQGSNAQLSRRKVLVGTAWVAPAIAVAASAPAAAASPGTQQIQDVTTWSVTSGSTGHETIARATISLGGGTVTGAQISVVFTPGNGSGAGVRVSGGPGWSPSTLVNSSPAAFTALGSLSGTSEISVVIEKAKADLNPDFTVTLSGYVNGSTTRSQTSYGGNLT